MKKSISAIILFGLSTIAIKSNAENITYGPKTILIDSAKRMVSDPVCKMKIKANASKTAIYNKVTYYFCSEAVGKSLWQSLASMRKSELDSQETEVRYQKPVSHHPEFISGSNTPNRCRPRSSYKANENNTSTCKINSA